MRIINPKPISEIREEKELLAEKDALILQLKQENEQLKQEKEILRSDSLMTMEAVAEVFEELLTLKEQINGGSN